jgi:hypothetical protein
MPLEAPVTMATGFGVLLMGVVFDAEIFEKEASGD